MFSADSDKRKLLSGLCHGSIFFSATIMAIGIPIAILLVSDDPIVKDNARESLNFHFNIWLYGLIFGFFAFFLIGLPFLWLLLLLSWILPILGILKVLNSPNEVYRYPFIFRVL